MCIIQTKCGAKGGSASLTVTTVAVRETPGSRIFAGNCTVVQSVRHFTTTAYASGRSSVCATKRAVDNNGVCERAFERVCDLSGGQRRRRSNGQ